MNVTATSNWLFLQCIISWHCLCFSVVQEAKSRKIDNYIFQEPTMYAKFPFYSVAQMYALSLNTPVAIMLGEDQLYWVVDQNNEMLFAQEGCSLLSHAF